MAIPHTNAMTFLVAPPISHPTTSVLVYGRKYGVENASWRRAARSSSEHAITVAAGCPSAISRARFGPDSAAMRDSGRPTTSATTSLMRMRVPVSMPLANEMTPASGSKDRTQVSRLPRRLCEGTASTTSSAPSRTSAGSVDADTLAGSTMSGR